MHKDKVEARAITQARDKWLLQYIGLSVIAMDWQFCKSNIKSVWDQAGFIVMIYSIFR
jgi:hypothetical protein